MKSPASDCNDCVTNKVLSKEETANHPGREWCYRGDVDIGRQFGTDFMLRKHGLGGHKRCGDALGDLICYDLHSATLILPQKFRNERDILPL